MAAEWIPVGVDLSVRTKVSRLARDRNVSRFEVVGLVVSFWGWASTQTADGFLDGIMLEDLPVLVGGTLEFWEAVVNVGWIEVSANGLTIPEFDKYLSKSGKARVQAKERQAAYRNDSKLSRSQRYENVTTEQNRTEHINNPLPLSKKSKPSKASPKKPTVEIPPTLAGEKFAEAWARWVRYRSERRKPLTPSTASKHLAKAERMGVDVAVEAIDRAIDRSYEAFFAPDSKPDLFSGSAPVVRDVDAEKAALLKHSMEMEERRANAQRN